MAKAVDESRTLTTKAQVMDALGGIHAIAALTGADWKNVETWSRSDFFPARYFLVMWLELVARGYWAPPALWRQNLPRNKEVVLTAFARKLRAVA